MDVAIHGTLYFEACFLRCNIEIDDDPMLLACGICVYRFKRISIPAVVSKQAPPVNLFDIPIGICKIQAFVQSSGDRVLKF